MKKHDPHSTGPRFFLFTIYQTKDFDSKPLRVRFTQLPHSYHLRLYLEIYIGSQTSPKIRRVQQYL